VTQDDLLYRFRLRTFAMAAELGNVRAACRAMGSIPRPTIGGSTSWTAMAPRSCGPGNGGPRAWPTRPACWSSSGWSPSPLAIPALGRPGSPLSWPDPNGGGIVLSTNGVWRVLRRHGLSTRAKRYGLVAGYAAPPEPQRPAPAPERHLDVEHPGQLVQLDCFCIGRLSGTKGTVWQYTAIDVASAYTWAPCRSPAATPQPPGPASSPAPSPPTSPSVAGSWSG
jgi:hypothetical protein